MTGRLTGLVIVLVSILFVPYWFYIPILLAAIIILPLFWEGIVFGFLIDVLYGGGVESVALLSFPFALAVLVILVALVPLRERLRSYV